MTREYKRKNSTTRKKKERVRLASGEEQTKAIRIRAWLITLGCCSHSGYSTTGLALLRVQKKSPQDMAFQQHCAPHFSRLACIFPAAKILPQDSLQKMNFPLDTFANASMMWGQVEQSGRQ
jgi:hypothetical protein